MEKQKVRDWMKQREQERKRVPPPTPDEIRRQLGWGLLNKSAECAR